MYYQCPVCGYNLLEEPPSNHAICPSCGTEFGYDDATKPYRRIRNEWLRSGAHWFSVYTQPPFLWNGFRQVIEAGFPFDVPTPVIKTTSFTIPVPVLHYAQLQVQIN